MGPLDFIKNINARIGDLTGVNGRPDANSVPSGQAIANAQIAPQQNPRGVWAILAQVARMRGQNQLSSLFAAKDEQDRQLKMRDVESQISSRTGNQDYMKALIENMKADNERADLAGKQNAAKMQIEELMKSEGTPTGVARNIAPVQAQSYPGQIGEFNPESNREGQTDVQHKNPDVNFPVGYGQPDLKITGIPTRGDINADALRTKIQEELYKGQNIPEGGRYVNYGLGVDLRNPKQFAPEKPDDLQKRFDAVKRDPRYKNLPDVDIYKMIANFGDNPLTAALQQERLDEMKKREGERTQNIDYYAHQLVPNDEGEIGIYADQLMRMLPRGMGRDEIGAIYQAAQKLFPKFSVNDSYLQGEASLKNLGNLQRADRDFAEADKNLKRMLEDYQEIKEAQAKGMWQNVGSAEMDLLARHLALTIGGVTGARVGKDIIEQHRSARSLPADIEANYQKLLNGGFLDEDQMKDFIKLGENSRNVAEQNYNRFKQAPRISGGLR